MAQPDFPDITLTDLPQSAIAPSESTASASTSMRRAARRALCTGYVIRRSDTPRPSLLCFCCSSDSSLLWLFYGLIPIFGGDQLGLVGADEPRYAQIAREMLDANRNLRCVARQHHAKQSAGCIAKASYRCLMGGTVTPILYGKPWLEKPALYTGGRWVLPRAWSVRWTARLASATGALALIILAFLHLKRSALEASGCRTHYGVGGGMFAFSRGASTDMQLAAPFCIGMLGGMRV